MIGEIRDVAMRVYVGALYLLLSFKLKKKNKKGQNGKTFLHPPHFTSIFSLCVCLKSPNFISYSVLRF